MRSVKTALAFGSLFAALTAGGSAATARTADFTIQQALSAPFPSSLTTAATAARVAWVSNKDGARNVWVADAAGGRAHAITAYTGDDGYDMGELALDSAGRVVVYTRGGSLEGGGPVNITSRPEGPEGQEVWTVSLAGRAPRLIGPGHGPEISPKGDRVAYIQGGQVWVAPLVSEGASAQLVHDRGQTEAVAWSPDGSRLAFVSDRGDHALVGVYDFAANAIRWMSPSVDTDSEPQWSPDGTRLAFIRVSAGKGNFFVAKRQGQPWAIWTADVATGAGRQVFVADPGPGSVFHPVDGAPLLWAAGDRLVFPWEKTGWLHFYSVPAAGGAATLLTPGDFEIFNAVLSPDRTRVVYSANQGDLDHRHLWEVSPAGGPPHQLTKGASIEDYPAVTADGRLFGLHADARNPLRAVAVDAGQMRDLAPGEISKDFPAAKLVEPKAVEFTAADGLMVHGQLFLPPAGVAQRGPALLFFHGGPIRQMLLGWNPMDAYAYMYAENQYLANEGYVVLSVNYRGGTGYGLNYREALNFGAGGASELSDILGAALYLRSRPDVDSQRIGIWGGSYGGLMTALGLSRASNLLAAGVDYAGVHDWKAFLPATTPTAEAQLAFDSSAVSTLDRWRSPVLVVHADDDRNVPFSQTVELVEGLRKHGVEVEQLILPDEIHDLLRHQSWITYFDAQDRFFQRHLLDAPAEK
ncbi:MAG: prolyl oligopeptidase family serine peptidase [Caulobacteraceae bacterium]